MAIDITTADRSMMRHVLNNLREADQIEMAACDTDLARLPEVILRHKVFVFCAYDLELGPVSIWGLIRRREGVGAGFAFGTDRWASALLPMVRQIRGFVLPFLQRAGFHRVEATAMRHRRDVARFMDLIGARPEAILQGYGTAGEDFVSYRWLADEHRYHSAAQGQDQHAAH